MKKITLFSIIVLAIAACKSLPPPTTIASKAELIMEIDGCKIYRFTDGFDHVYFSNCQTSQTASK